MPMLPALEVSADELAELRADVRLIKNTMRVLQQHRLSMADKLALRLLERFDAKPSAERDPEVNVYVKDLHGPSIG